VVAGLTATLGAAAETRMAALERLAADLQADRDDSNEG
jgi:hypothetical protein